MLLPQDNVARPVPIHHDCDCMKNSGDNFPIIYGFPLGRKADFSFGLHGLRYGKRLAMGPIGATRDLPSGLGDGIAGDSNRRQLTEVLRVTLEEALKLRSSCGFLLVAIDDLDQINETYGFDVGNQVITAVAQRVRAQIRGKDHVGRLSGSKFGVVINNCTPTDMLTAAERLLAGVPDEPVQTDAGPLAVTVTIGGVTAPRYGRDVHEVLTRAEDALDIAKVKGAGSFEAYRPSAEMRRVA
jgi:diguanylate cyclase (GGDEF)-like protein